MCPCLSGSGLGHVISRPTTNPIKPHHVIISQVRPDGRGLQPHADPRVVERVGFHMATHGYTPAQVQRFLMPHGGCDYGRLDAATYSAIRGVLVAAGYRQADLKTHLAAAGQVAAAATPAATLAAMAYALAAAGTTADQIRQLMRPAATPAVAAAAAAAEKAEKAGGVKAADAAAAAAAAGRAAVAAVVTPEVGEVIRNALLAAGYSSSQLSRVMRHDGTGLRADVGPLRLAQVVAALASVDLPPQTIRMFIR